MQGRSLRGTSLLEAYGSPIHNIDHEADTDIVGEIYAFTIASKVIHLGSPRRNPDIRALKLTNHAIRLHGHP